MEHLLPGTQVWARGLTWEIVRVEPAGRQSQLRLRCLEGVLENEELDLYSPLEEITALSMKLKPDRPVDLERWCLYHQAFQLEQALGTDATLSEKAEHVDDDSSLQWSNEPVVNAVQSARPRFLLVDSSWAGAKMQVGLIVSELISSQRAERILMVTPTGSRLEQWDREMRSRFGVNLTVLDRSTLRDLRRHHGPGSNPFDHISRGLISIDVVERQSVFLELVSTTYDMVIIDEICDLVTPPRINHPGASNRQRLAEKLAGCSQGLLLITSKPSDGLDASLVSLARLLDPSLVDSKGSVHEERFRRHVIRQEAHRVGAPAPGEAQLVPRQIIPCPVLFLREIQPVFAAFQKELISLVAPVLKQASRHRRYDEVFPFISLLKRSISTPAAARHMLALITRRYKALAAGGGETEEERRQRLSNLHDYRTRLERYGVLSPDEERELTLLGAEQMAAKFFTNGGIDPKMQLRTGFQHPRNGRDRKAAPTPVFRKLQRLINLADRARSEDPKSAELIGQIREIRSAEPGANVVIFTEYGESKDVIVEQLRESLEERIIAGDVLALDGRESDSDRTSVIDRFSNADNLVLVSTDATAEGLGLNRNCRHLIHFELSYNPDRLERRNKCIGRHGQTEAPVICYLYLSGTFEERAFLSLAASYEHQRVNSGSTPTALATFAGEGFPALARLIDGLGEEDAFLFRSSSEEISFETDNAERVIPNGPYKAMLAQVESSLERCAAEKSVEPAAALDVPGSGTGSGSSAAAARNSIPGRTADVERELNVAGFNLFDFVCRALEADGGAISNDGEDTVILKLTKDWTAGLDGLPGYDAAAKILRLTRDPNRISGAGSELGFMGRAHPVVRRAIDRVRSGRFMPEGAELDRRVSAVCNDVDRPELLFSFLATVESGTGRELERIIAVRVRPRGRPSVYMDPSDWNDLLQDERQIPAQGVWERYFASWGEERLSKAQLAAQHAFVPLAEAFIEERKAQISQDKEDLGQWARKRYDELCDLPAERRLELVSAARNGSSNGTARRASRQPRNGVYPTEKLARWVEDHSNPAAKRRAAGNVLSFCQARIDEFEHGADLRVRQPALIGLLMLVPQGEGKKS